MIVVAIQISIRRKILHDIIDTTSLLLFRKNINQSGLSTSEIIGKCQSLMCHQKNNGTITIEAPNRQVKEYYKLFNFMVPAHLNESIYRKSIGLKM